MLAGGWTGERGTTDPSLAPVYHVIRHKIGGNSHGWDGLGMLEAMWTSDLMWWSLLDSARPHHKAAPRARRTACRTNMRAIVT